MIIISGTLFLVLSLICVLLIRLFELKTLLLNTDKHHVKSTKREGYYVQNEILYYFEYPFKRQDYKCTKIVLHVPGMADKKECDEECISYIKRKYLSKYKEY